MARGCFFCFDFLPLCPAPRIDEAAGKKEDIISKPKH
jgi:hypothetical protein